MGPSASLVLNKKIEPHFLGLAARSKAAIPTELCRLLTNEILFPVSETFRPALEPTQPTFQPVLQSVLPGVERPGRESLLVLKKIMHGYKPPHPLVSS